MVAIQKNIIKLKMNQVELDELNEFIDFDVDDGDFLESYEINEEWLSEFGITELEWENVDGFMVELISNERDYCD